MNKHTASLGIIVLSFCLIYYARQFCLHGQYKIRIIAAIDNETTIINQRPNAVDFVDDCTVAYKYKPPCSHQQKTKPLATIK